MRGKIFILQDLITDRAIGIINSHDASTPLFIFFSSPLVHEPIQVSRHYNITCMLIREKYAYDNYQVTIFRT